MKVTVFGVGYVGLVSAVGFAEIGHVVTCFTRSARKAQLLSRGIPTIYEPGLREALRRNLRRRRISFTTDKQEAIRSSDIIVIAVGTPPLKGGGADLSAVLSVARDIGKYADRPKLVVTKSTVPVGTGEKVLAVLQPSLKRRNIVVDVASNPEFLREGAALQEFLKPDRIVVGVATKKAAALMRKLYRPITATGRPLVVTDTRSSEMIKYASNAFLATKLSFINEIARFCDRVGADVTEVARGVGLDARIGPSFLRAGIGYGGSCLPKDVSALVSSGRRVHTDFKILRAARAVNERQWKIVLEKLRTFVPSLRGKTFALWGLSFKPNTDDLREAPSLKIINAIREAGGTIRAYDPAALTEAKKQFRRAKGVTLVTDKYHALRGAHALVLVTEWEEFRKPNFRRMKTLMRAPNVVDGRNVFDPDVMLKHGFHYLSVGRPS